MYKNARCPIRIKFERRLVAANSLQKQPKRRLGRTRRLVPRADLWQSVAAIILPRRRRYDRIALAAGSDSVRALFGDFFYA